MCTNKPQSTQTEELRFSVAAPAVGDRLDRFLAARSEVSRSQIQLDIRAGKIRVNGEPIEQASYRLRENDQIVWMMDHVPLLSPARIPLSILFEDDQLVAIDKPIGLVVHPGAGTHETTLVEALLADRRLPMSDDPARPGIVHRLDKETSGVILVAKTHHALTVLQAQFADRSTIKFYLAVVAGRLTEDSGVIDAPIGRDPTLPSRMAVQAAGKKSLTEFRVLDRATDRSLLLLLLHTGRTHQLRVHLKYIGHPVLGDSTYGARGSGDQGRTPDAGHADKESAGRQTLAEPVAGQIRLMLHAWRVQVRHPATGEELRIEAPAPSEFPAYDYPSLGWEKNAVRP